MRTTTCIYPSIIVLQQSRQICYACYSLRNLLPFLRKSLLYLLKEQTQWYVFRRQFVNMAAWRIFCPAISWRNMCNTIRILKRNVKFWYSGIPGFQLEWIYRHKNTIVPNFFQNFLVKIISKIKKWKLNIWHLLANTLWMLPRQKGGIAGLKHQFGYYSTFHSNKTAALGAPWSQRETSIKLISVI
jgi:hypothetical protein